MLLIDYYGSLLLSFCLTFKCIGKKRCLCFLHVCVYNNEEVKSNLETEGFCYVYIYIYTHTHTHTHTKKLSNGVKIVKQYNLSLFNCERGIFLDELFFLFANLCNARKTFKLYFNMLSLNISLNLNYLKAELALI